MRSTRFTWLAVAAIANGCDGGAAPPTSERPAAHACAPGSVEQDGGACVAPGVPADACGDGFASNGRGGCDAVLPASPCAPGEMAIPGETQCRDVAPCADGKWGGIPVDAATQYVDASAAAGGDGSAAAPWTNIAEGVIHAPAKGLVAVAAGTYNEDIGLLQKPVRIWGRCPSLVHIVGTGFQLGAIVMQQVGDGAEVHRLAISGAQLGIVASGAADALIEDVWIHDTALMAIDFEGTLGPTSATVRNVLIESVAHIGIQSAASRVTVERTVVRDVAPAADDTLGFGLEARWHPSAASRGSLTVRDSVVERSTNANVFVMGGDASIERTVLRDAVPGAEPVSGRGVALQDDLDAMQRSTLVLRASVVSGNHGIGIWAIASDVTIDATTVRDMLPDASNGYSFARGISVEMEPTSGDRSNLTLTRSLIENCPELGLMISGTDAMVSSLIVRAASGDAGPRGRGVAVQAYAGQKASLTMSASLIERSSETGLVVSGSEAALEGDEIRDIAKNAAGEYGDGVVVYSSDFPAAVTLARCRVEGASRAGVSSFGASVSLRDTELECDPILLDGETYAGSSATFEDGGGNECGCDGTAISCHALTSNLAPPRRCPHRRPDVLVIERYARRRAGRRGAQGAEQRIGVPAHLAHDIEEIAHTGERSSGLQALCIMRCSAIYWTHRRAVPSMVVPRPCGSSASP